MSKLAFTAYEHNFVIEKELITRYLIVVKDEELKVNVLWTDWHKYIEGGKAGKVRSMLSKDKIKFTYVAKFLNYVFFEKGYAERLEDITPDMVKEFMQNYGMKRLEGDDENTSRGEHTVEVCMGALKSFMIALARSRDVNTKFREKDLFVKEKVFNKRKHRAEEVEKFSFDVRYVDKAGKKIFRDIPEKAFRIIFNHILRHHKNLLMVVAFSAFAGLRPSEACNVRREDSQLGPGIRFEKVNNEITNVYIDLTQKLNLRSDLKDVGGIKKFREQRVYPSFLKVFQECYEEYTAYIEGRKYETEYGPLTTDRNGKAYRYGSYYREFQKAVKECIPIMLRSDDPELVNYGLLLQEEKIGMHAFRHWFSAKLALYGETPAELMYWRGDKSPEAALTYIQNKSDLEKQYASAVEEIFNFEMWKAEKKYGK